MNSEHIIPLALGGINGFEIPVCREFNSTVGSKVDAKIGNELIIKSRRAKLNVLGHSKKTASLYYKNARDAETGLPLQVKITKEKGMQIRAPYVPPGSKKPTGKHIEFTTTSDIDIWLKYVAKVALSGGYFAYGSLFREHANTNDLRNILTMSNSELLKKHPDIKVHAHYLYMEDDSDDIKLFKHICQAVGDNSCLGIIPSDNHLTFFAGILGGYVGMLKIEANTKLFPNQDEYRWGHFMCPQNGHLSRVSYHRLLEKLFENKTNK